MRSRYSFIQFIGTQRSGSNLLRVMLNQLPEISAPHPPHILKTFFPLLPSYGDLQDENNFFLLAKDVCEWVNVNPVPWEGIRLDPHDVVQRSESNSLIEIFRVIYTVKAETDGADIWCCKSMETVHYVDKLEQSGMKPIYLHLYRDGRDVAVSFLNAIVGPKHVYYLAKKWTEEQQQSLFWKASIPSERFISVKYEDMLADPPGQMKLLCERLAVPYNENLIFDYFHSNESINTARSGVMWRNLARPILKNNHHKFLAALSNEELAIFETVAGDTLKALGYERVTSGNRPISAEDIEAFKNQNDLALRHAIGRANEIDLKNREPQEKLLRTILSRTVKFC